jgi:hypothetical protein
MSEREQGHDAIMVELRYIKDGMDELRELERERNGRLRTAENDIAVLKDREAKKAGGLAGSVGGFAGGFLASFLSSLWK